ncbi:hypothetical protein L228DRAFT_140759 [Xylona heveae TC161]|uniref:CCD97-like C-terminal domain-containing protein n=1 Tax=Xylona heveae (strain CBS 132557 / TC161) TaxID=1328760 RepID=A0A165H4L9_XYLHT|nr:hypothetical protein L228DRAFT_140759 [Xylona heveae TC161]KZF22978.1 hypothetical protein L228DRAFT_140759 [Xylona heveae TC161]
MPFFPANIPSSEYERSDTGMSEVRRMSNATSDRDDAERTHHIRVKNRRKHYLDEHPEYFSASLELADPLLYDRLVRRFQTPAEREAEGRAKGYSGILEADLHRSEAKIEALAHPSSSHVTYKRGPQGEIYPEEKDEIPLTKEEGRQRWEEEMMFRFLRGEDGDFDYALVDDNDEWDDRKLEEREAQDRYFDDEEPSWMLDDGISYSGDAAAEKTVIKGETGVQDF